VLQILFDRMIVSAVVSTIYMWYFKTEEFPLGPKPVRSLLALRGVAGFFGVSGMFLSLQYLSLSDATVISFLAPPLACFACSYILKEPFTRTEQIATAISLFSIVLIAQPSAIFELIGFAPAAQSETNGVTPQQRLLGVAFCLMGVLGGGTQLICLRCVGKRAHPLISVNYLNVIVAIMSGTMLTVLPGLNFAFPPTFVDWLYLSILSASGIMLVSFAAVVSFECFH
jgi:drug/metabolite transporter (DMT)-like permease